MFRLAPVIVAALATMAHAQPGMAPLQPTASPAASVADRPWSIEGGFGWLAYESKANNPQVENPRKVGFFGLDLAAHYRFRPAMQVGLTVFVAGSKDLIGTGGLFLEFRYRFMAERPWNIYAHGGLGVVSVSPGPGPGGATDDEKKGRGALRLGAGVERRFARWGLHAELRFVGVGENKALDMPGLSGDSDFARAPLAGVSLTFGGTYYF